jgi:hypothetical protein
VWFVVKVLVNFSDQIDTVAQAGVNVSSVVIQLNSFFSQRERNATADKCVYSQL